MNLEQIQQISNGLRVTPNPREWFDDPLCGTNSPQDWYTWDHMTAYTATNVNPWRGRRSATQVNDKRFGMTFWLDTIAGANLIWEASKRWEIIPSVISSFAIPWFWSMRLNRSNPIGSDLGEKYQGIFYGDGWDLNTPWNTGWAGAATIQGRVHLAYNFTASKWQVQVFLVDGTPPDNFDCTLQPPFAVDNNLPEVSLLWVPPFSDQTKSRLVAMVNGQVVLDLFDNARCNQLLGPAIMGGPGIFWTNGSNAASSCSEGGFYTGRLWTPIPTA